MSFKLNEKRKADLEAILKVSYGEINPGAVESLIALVEEVADDCFSGGFNYLRGNTDNIKYYDLEGNEVESQFPQVSTYKQDSRGNWVLARNK